MPERRDHEDPGGQSGFDEFQVPPVGHDRRAAARPRQRSTASAARRAACRSTSVGRCAKRRLPVPDHAVAVQRCLADLTDPETGCLASPSEVSAIGLKAVHGGRISGVQRVTPEVLDAMEEVSDIAPAHNPPYVAAMRLLGEKLPEIPLVAAFETGFHATMPDRVRYFGIPYEWAEELSIKRFGFHGASHRYISTRIVEILRAAEPALDVARLRVISCHLGGSSSLCAIRGGASVATSMGLSPQSGVPQNNRVGDLDPFALPLLMAKTGKSLDRAAGRTGPTRRPAGPVGDERRHPRPD